MTGQIFFGGSVQDGGPVTVTKDKELSVGTREQEIVYTDVDISDSARSAICQGKAY
jgi:hypothetical protein